MPIKENAKLQKKHNSSQKCRIFAIVMARTTKYIFVQAEHHKTKTYHDEYCETLKAYGIEYDERFAFGD